MKHIILYGLSITISWAAATFLFATFNASEQGFSALAQQFRKTAVTAEARNGKIVPDPALDMPAFAADDEDLPDEIPVTIMHIPSPQPRAKPPKTGKDAPPPPMEI